MNEYIYKSIIRNNLIIICYLNNLAFIRFLEIPKTSQKFLQILIK
ncbi:hypothetical protein pb186bvf_006948 [Paramecium bursaria]